MKKITVLLTAVFAFSIGLKKPADAASFGTNDFSQSEIQQKGDTILPLPRKSLHIVQPTPDPVVESPKGYSRQRICSSEPINQKEPLYLLNGRPAKLEKLHNLTPEQLADVKVLKRDEAVALYGSLGENGAVIITTKKKAKKKN